MRNRLVLRAAPAPVSNRHGGSRCSHAAQPLPLRRRKPRISRAFSEADDGTRTHDLLHGKRVVGSGTRVANAYPCGVARLRHPARRSADTRRFQGIPSGLHTRTGLVPKRLGGPQAAWLTVARLPGVSTLRRRIHEGALPAVRIGPTDRSPIRIDPRDLEPWLFEGDDEWEPSTPRSTGHDRPRSSPNSKHTTRRAP